MLEYFVKIEAIVGQFANNLEKLIALEIQVCRIDLSLAIEPLINKVNKYFHASLEKWVDDLKVIGATVDKAPLIEAEYSVAALERLENLRTTLLPTDYTKLFPPPVVDSMPQLSKVSKGGMMVRTASTSLVNADETADTAAPTKDETSTSNVKSANVGKDGSNNEVAATVPPTTSYLVDPEYDCTEEANDQLSDELFLKYYICKLAVLELDAKESVFQKNVRRLEMLQEIIVRLQQTQHKRMKVIEEKQQKQATTVAASNANASSSTASAAAAATVQPASAEASTTAPGVVATIKPSRRRSSVRTDLLPELDTISAQKLVQAGMKLKTRNEAIIHIDKLIEEINSYIDIELDAGKTADKSDFKLLKKKVKKCVAVIEELQSYREQAKYLPQLGYPTTEEEIKLAKHLLVPPLGLVIHVADENALAWGERDDADNNNDEYYDSDQQQQRGGGDQETKWRPMIQSQYPYNQKLILTLKKDQFDFRYMDNNTLNNNKESSSIPGYKTMQPEMSASEFQSYAKELTYALYYNVMSNKKKEKAEDGTGGAGDTAASASSNQVGGDNGKTTSVAPTHFGVWYNDKLIGNPIKIDKSDNTIEVDFYSIICQSETLVNLDDDEDIKLTVEFLVPTNDESTAVNKQKVEKKLPNGPSLILILSNKDEHDYDNHRGDEDGEDGEDDDYYNYAYGDGEGVGGDDDDDDDEDDDDNDDDYQVYQAKSKAEAADLVEQYLPEQVTLEEHEEHPLIKERVWRYTCDICGEAGQGLSYRCDEDDYDVHPQCAIDEDTFEEYCSKVEEKAEKMMKLKNKTTLMIVDALPKTLTFDGHEDHTLTLKDCRGDGDDFYCDVCGMLGNSYGYHCHECEDGYIAHPHCVFTDFDNVASKIRKERLQRGEPDMEALLDDEDNKDEGEGKDEEEEKDAEEEEE